MKKVVKHTLSHSKCLSLKKGEGELCTGYCRLISIGGPRSMIVRGRIDYWVRMDIRVHSKSLSNWVVDSMGKREVDSVVNRVVESMF